MKLVLLQVTLLPTVLEDILQVLGAAGSVFEKDLSSK